LAVRDIGRDSVMEAIAEFDRLGRVAFFQKYELGEGRTRFLVHEGKRYDAKAIVGAAHGYAQPNSGPLKPSDFKSGDALRLLQGFKFELAPKDDDRTETAEWGLEPSKDCWWVNHKQTYAQEVGGGYLWSPQNRSDGARSVFYDNMTRVRPGDLVFSYAGGHIRAVGVCTAPAALAPKPAEFGSAGDVWSNEGWRVSVAFHPLRSAFRPKDHMDRIAPVLPASHAPIRATGDGNQVAYLAHVPRAMAEVLFELIGDDWPKLDQINDRTVDDAEASENASEEIATEVIRNRTDIGDTEKQTLVTARRGQGVYRRNLESHEVACRVTGVTKLRHLRASHIKPWRLSNDFEKLDGNNGLLLSPHVDHLFDRGFISFTGSGQLLVSNKIGPDVLAAWGISEGQNCGDFREEQRDYLAFHRNSIFRK
jgi:HNH endonuclease